MLRNPAERQAGASVGILLDANAARPYATFAGIGRRRQVEALPPECACYRNRQQVGRRR